MSDFIVSARKYRPATFSSVVGQKHITSTLKNAIERGQLAHAYLFCGPRGVGKTTCARIFAKAINCLAPDGAEACNECESCRSFNEGRSLNIHELDAASNNSVEDIRSLIEQVRIIPQVGRYSVFIIDEVHMLSAAAFNAFLKTLEEPPAHAIFILATTEKHKIIPTILSRCQIYDFNRIRVEDGVDDPVHDLFVPVKVGLQLNMYHPEVLRDFQHLFEGGDLLACVLGAFPAAEIQSLQLAHGQVVDLAGDVGVHVHHVVVVDDQLVVVGLLYIHFHAVCTDLHRLAEGDQRVLRGQIGCTAVRNDLGCRHLVL